MTFRNIGILAASMLIPVGLATAAFAQRDQITPLSGAAISGAIGKVTPNDVEIDVRGTLRRIPVNEIARITFDDEPGEMKTARSRALDGQYEDAAALLGRIPPETLTRDILRQDLEYYRAFAQARLALTGGGDKTAAAKSLVDFVTAHPDSFHYYEAVQIIGDLAYVMARYDAASDYYRKLAAAPWPDYQMQAKVLEARALMAQSKFVEALQRYDEVTNVSIDNANALRQKKLAQIGRANCLAETGKPDEGREIVEAIIRDNDPQDTELFAHAYNALGTCHVKSNRTKDALLAFLHVDLLFAADGDSHAEALYYLGQLWTAVGKSDRAVAARSLLQSRYAGTIWASK